MDIQLYFIKNVATSYELSQRYLYKNIVFADNNLIGLF